MSEFGGQLCGAGLFDFVLGGEQRCLSGGFPSFGNDGSPFVDGGEKLVVFSEDPAFLTAEVGEPDIGGRNRVL